MNLKVNELNWTVFEQKIKDNFDISVSYENYRVWYIFDSMETRIDHVVQWVPCK